MIICFQLNVYQPWPLARYFGGLNPSIYTIHRVDAIPNIRPWRHAALDPCIAVGNRASGTMSGPPTLNFKSRLTRPRRPHLCRSASCQVIKDHRRVRQLYVDVHFCTARRPMFLPRVSLAAPPSASCTPAASPQPPTHYALRVDSRTGLLCCARNFSRRRTSSEWLELIYHRPEARPQASASPFSRWV